MSVQAMFYVASVTKLAAGNGEPTLQVVLLPVTRNVKRTADGQSDPSGYESANVQWSKYTPGGKIEMTITAEGAQSFFEGNLGKDVPIHFG